MAIFGADLAIAPTQPVVTIGGLNAQILFTSATQLNAQLPFDIPVGNALLTLTVPGSAPIAIDITISQYAPAIFADDRRRLGNFENAAGLITLANPAIPGETIVAYAAGLGAAGAIPAVTVGGIAANVLSMEPQPDRPGAYRVKFVVPSAEPGTPDVVLSIGGFQSPAVRLPVGVRRAPGALAMAGRTIQHLSANLESAAPRATRDLSLLVSQPAPRTSPQGIVYTCDATINALAGVCSTLNSTIAGLYSAAFTNANASIYITFGSTDLGESYTGLELISYSSYRTALIASESSANDTTAITDSVPQTSPFPSNDVVAVTTANARALGFSASPGITGSDSSCCYDGMITISSSMQSSGDLYYRSGSIGSNQYDFYSVVEHETDEVLGTASCVFGCNFSGTIAFAPADLFRYHSSGSRSYAAGNNNSCASSNSSNACFSIDGVHMLQQYNNLNNGEDGGDWAPNCAHPLVQNSESCPGIAGLNISPTAEIEVLDVVGFNLATCSYSLSSNAASVGAGSSTGTVNVITGGGCSWNASSNAAWLSISSGSSGSGDGTVGYSVQANPGNTSRSAILTIAGAQTFTVTQAGGVTAVSVSPTAQTKTSQTFTLQYSDSLGAANLSTAWVDFAAVLGNGSNSCLLYYAVGANTINLVADNGSTLLTATPGTVTTLQNSQCSLNVASVTVTPSGNTLTLSLPLSFKPAYAGAKSIFMYVAGASANNGGWQQMGSWTVPGGITVSAVSVSPSAQTGAIQTFTLQYSDSAGAASLSSAWVDFASALGNGSSSCLVYYAVAANTINLVGDNGSTLSTATPGAATTLQNSQCSLNVASMTVTPSGNTLTLSLPLTFKPAYGGAKSIFMFAADTSGANNGGWQPLGSWTVPGGITVTAVSVSPSAQTGAIQTFTLQYSDSAGAASLSAAYVDFTAALGNGSSSCLLYYAVAANTINLVGDNGSTLLTATPGAASTTLANSQCSLNVTAMTATPSGNTLTLSLPLTFKPAYAGAKSIFMFAADTSGANNGGWQTLGSWTVPGGVTVTSVSVSPSAQTGAIQTFTLQYSDSAGAASLSAAYVDFTAALGNGSSSCLLYYAVAANTINLVGDNGSTLLTATPGAASTTLANSQCSLNVTAMTVTPSGNNLTLTLPLTFQAAYAGAKSIFMYAADMSGANTGGWQTLGTWTVPN